MVRQILEDIKLNKNKKQTIFKKNVPSLPVKIPRTPEIKTKPKVLHKSVLFIFILTLVIGGGYWGGNIFQRAKITITSKHQPINYKNKQFIAGKNENNNSVNFEIMITSDKEKVNVILTEAKEVSIKAQGSVTLYNEFSSKPEKISAGTFLSDNEGKTYKTNNTVSIPGYKIENKKIVPGQTNVNIISFLAGEVYNGTPSNFYINSFKGSVKYKKIYGKLKTPLTGGLSGLVYSLNKENQKNLDNIANVSFKEELLRQVRSLVPPGYILYPEALTFSYKIGESFLSKTPEAEIEIEGMLTVVLLDEKSLMDNIVKISFPNIKGDELKEIKILGLNKLSFSFINTNQSIAKNTVSIPFSLTGDIDAVWNPDIEILKTKLLGIHKNNILDVFKQDPGISKAIVEIFPPWQKYIPNGLSRIKIDE